MATPGKAQVLRADGFLSVRQDLSQRKLIHLFLLCLTEVQTQRATGTFIFSTQLVPLCSFSANHPHSKDFST